jgi:UPF0271 protein
MTPTIDLNADVGERPEALADGTEEGIIRLVSSANIACGGHAGDEETMERVIRLCMKYNVAVGAHPGYPDRAHFGRERLVLSPEAIQETVFEQVRRLGMVAERLGAEVRHVKPHGALYNTAAHDRAVAEAIAKGVAQWRGNLTLVGLAGSLMLTVWEERGSRTAGEAFADRTYESDGTLRSRKKGDALITDPERAVRQALRIIRNRSVLSIEGKEIPIEAKTISVHSDTPHAAVILSAIRQRLDEEGIPVKALDW